MKKVPWRTCVGCRGSFPQKQLLRITAFEETGVSVDYLQKKPGRGAYLCLDEACVDQAKKRQSLQRALRCPVPEMIWIDIDQAVKNAGKREE